MNRIKKELKYSFDNGPALKGEGQQHYVKGKPGKAYMKSSAPRGLRNASSGLRGDVHYGSHANISRQIGEELRKWGL